MRKVIDLITVVSIGAVIVACGSGQNNTMNHYAYISNGGASAGGSGKGTISVCSLTESGGIINCNINDISQDDDFSPSSIAINNNHAYINDTNSALLYICEINESSLVNCTTSTPTNYISTAFGGISIQNNYLYASAGSSFAESASFCQINENNLAPSSCTIITSIPSGLSGVFSFSNQFAYIADYDHNKIQKCLVGVDGALSNCGESIPDITLSDPVGVVTNGNYAYVANSGTQNISAFSIDSLGNFTFIDSSGINSIGSNGNINNMSIFNNNLYIPNNQAVGNVPNNSIAKCNINNNSSINCSYYTDATFNVPQSITIK